MRRELEVIVRRGVAAQRRKIVRQGRRDENFNWSGDVDATDRCGERIWVEVTRYLHPDGTQRVGLGLGQVVNKRGGRIQFIPGDDGNSDGDAIGIETTYKQHVVLLTAEQAEALSEAILAAGQGLEGD